MGSFRFKNLLILYIKMTECKSCNQNLNECKKYSISEKDAICNKCSICKNCAKKYYKRLDTICKTCCQLCKRCDKLLLKNNWPIDIIRYSLCDKCFHLCKTCEKYISEDKTFYKKENTRYCKTCFENKFLPKDNKHKYALVTKKEETGKLFINWKKTHKLTLCSCDKSFFSSLRRKNELCPKCKKTNNNKPKDPSDNNKQYMLKSNEYILKQERKICRSCYTSVWININNINNFTNCDNCNPSNNNIKYKYNKTKQLWIGYRFRIKCKSCLIYKWMYNKDDICNKCKKMYKR